MTRLTHALLSGAGTFLGLNELQTVYLLSVPVQKVNDIYSDICQHNRLRLYGMIQSKVSTCIEGKGIGGGSRPKKIVFVHFNICYSPIFLLSKMGLYVSKLSKSFVL